MSNPIAHSDYMENVTENATRVATWAEEDAAGDGPYDDAHDAIYDLVRDVLDGHEWFTRSYYGPSAHGCVIEYALDADVDASRTVDLAAYAEGDDIARIVKRLAFVVFEAHVIDRATELVNDDNE
jgi:hypothetical protein